MSTRLGNIVNCIKIICLSEKTHNKYILHKSDFKLFVIILTKLESDVFVFNPSCCELTVCDKRVRHCRFLLILVTFAFVSVEICPLA
jgi:hypothetical protein